MIGQELHSLKVNVPRIFYVNSRKQKEGEGASKHISRVNSCDVFSVNSCYVFMYYFHAVAVRSHFSFT